MSESVVNNSKSVAILMGVYNGSKYIAAQLDSLAAQTHNNWRLIVSDDGSSDATLQIVKNYQAEWGADKVEIRKGPQTGFAQNFLSLACDPAIKADYYAYSDQDDIWESDHLSRALECLKAVPQDVPALYSSRTRYITTNGSELGLSTLFKKPASFRNALVQSIAGGNTMVFNQMTNLLLAKTPVGVNIVSHDWWMYMLVSGAGGQVFYDSYPGVQYRQHGNNVRGQNTTLLAKSQRIKMLLAGRFRRWNQINLNALNEMSESLTFENRLVLDLFGKARNGSVLSRLYSLYRSGVYRQTFGGNIGLLVASLLNRI